MPKQACSNTEILLFLLLIFVVYIKGMKGEKGSRGRTGKPGKDGNKLSIYEKKCKQDAVIKTFCASKIF